MTADDGSPEEKVDSKVARLIERYELGEDFGDRIEQLWTAEGEKRESLRSLVARFNKRLLEATINDTEMSTVEEDVSKIYCLLTDDSVSSGNRTEARQRLQQSGINIGQLEQDFITYQAIRTYLKDYRGAAYDRDSETTRVETVIETVRRLRSRTRSVAERSIDQLNNTGRISIGGYRLFIDISVLCQDCNTQYELTNLLRTGGCECDNK